MKLTSLRWMVAGLVGCATAVGAQERPDTVSSLRAAFTVDVVMSGVEQPAGLAFLPDGRGLLVERPSGRLSLFDGATGSRTAVEGVPPVYGRLGAGLLEVLPHPDFEQNRWLYLSYSEGDSTGNTTVVDRARLEGNRLVDRSRLFTAHPLIADDDHFGGRMVLDRGYLFLTVGDRHDRAGVQDLGAHNGKVIRLHEDGSVPADNPFAHTPGALPEIWTLGHRNPQGLAVHPGTGELWLHEHGPMGGDEINVVEPGRNYGWPVVTYGQEYEGGPVGEGLTEAPGMEPPLYAWVPSIAPSGMLFYQGNAFPEWKGDILVGAMGLQHLERLTVGPRRIIHEERLLENRGWRVRSLAVDPDGLIYLGVDAGYVLRLTPR